MNMEAGLKLYLKKPSVAPAIAANPIAARNLSSNACTRNNNAIANLLFVSHQKDTM